MPASVIQAKRGVVAGGGVEAAIIDPVPMVVPVMILVPIASFEWSPTMHPMNWRPVRSRDWSGDIRIETSP